MAKQLDTWFWVLIIVGLPVLFRKELVAAIKNLRQMEVSRPARVAQHRKSAYLMSDRHGLSSNLVQTHYITFEVEGGSREEYAVPDHDYRQLADGDVGTLRSRGSWYRGFESKRTTP